MSGALLDCRPPRMHALLSHLHRGLNIIKNDHQRARCKQITLVGAWRTNSAKGRTRSEAICGSSQPAPARSVLLFSSFFPPRTFTHAVLRDCWAAAGFYQVKSRVLFFTRTSSEIFGTPGKLFINPGRGSVQSNAAPTPLWLYP